ncbi:unnamed protein product [Leptosia nina]|uniref:Lipase domain-containing protein n=1 Tax=Leptosia nina TaxID=320188 RepID=A0AAV1J639_9NEOP
MNWAITCVLLIGAASAAQFPMRENQVVFHLFTRDNPTSSQALLPSIPSIATSRFLNSRKTIIALHSFGENVQGNFIAHVVPAHLAAENVNFLAVDWRFGSFAYSAGVANVPQLGELVARFVNILTNDFGNNVNMIRIIGVGLGAHAAGVAGRRIVGNIPHIVALDPPLLGWTHNPNKLLKTDANLVEVLHTTATNYGYGDPLGHVDFYANGGRSQPMCGDLVLTCSHIYSYIYYAESINADAEANAKKFVGTKCASYEETASQACNGTRDATFGGIAVKSSESGIYSFATNVRQPFAKG